MPHRFVVLAAAMAAQAAVADPVGSWRGEYFCNQGLTGMTLEIARAEPDAELRAIFVFYEVDANPGVPDGCYEMSGRYDPASGHVVLTAGAWIRRPIGYVTVDLDGALDQSGETFSGAVFGYNCTTFELHRAAAPAPSDHACYDDPNVAGDFPSGGG